MRSLVSDRDVEDLQPLQTPALPLEVAIVEDVPPVLQAESDLDTVSCASDNEVDDSTVETVIMVNEGETQPVGFLFLPIYLTFLTPK